MRFAWPAAVLLLPAAVVAQQPVSRADAVAGALARGARLAVSRADTLAALGAARTARAFPNPTVSGSYTKDTPNYHALADLPLDVPWLRSPRIGAAEATRAAARYQFAFDRLGIVFDVDTSYTRTVAAGMRARLSRRTADDADSLLKIAQIRRDVGDVSELDVRLAAVNAGQLENTALDDSLAALSALVSLQLQIGLAGDSAAIVLVDSLLVLDDGSLVEVVAAPESLIEARAGDVAGLARLAWHLGDRHVAIEMLPNRIRARREPAIEALLATLGAKLAFIEAPFEPEGGAYDAHAHDHAHAHGHHHH